VRKAKVNIIQEAQSAAADAFRRWAPELHRFIARRMRNPASAPDLTQEIFERFLQMPATKEVHNTQRFLYGIASNLVREFYDREDRSRVKFDSEAVDSAANSVVTEAHEDPSERLALQQDLRRALAALPPMHRVVLLLVKRDGLSYEEVAQRTNLSLTTVTKYVFEARARMKILLKSQPGEAGTAP